MYLQSSFLIFPKKKKKEEFFNVKEISSTKTKQTVKLNNSSSESWKLFFQDKFPSSCTRVCRVAVISINPSFSNDVHRRTSLIPLKRKTGRINGTVIVSKQTGRDSFQCEALQTCGCVK